MWESPSHHVPLHHFVSVCPTVLWNKMGPQGKQLVLFLFHISYDPVLSPLSAQESKKAAG